MAKKIAKTRRILKAKISFLSLCPRGMNHIQTVYKTDDGGEHKISLAMVIKDGMSEQGELLAVVYAPDMVDGEGDTATAKVIKEFAYDFAANGAGIDITHNEDVLPVEDAFIAESFIIQKEDSRFADTKDYDGNSINVTGGWGVVLKIANEGLRTAYREGEWGGISMGGLMLVDSDESEMSKLAKMLSNFITGKSKTNKSNKSNAENTMLVKEDKTRIATLVTETMSTVNKEASEAAAKKAKEAEETSSKKKGLGLIAPVLKENPSETEIKQHVKNLQIFNISEAVDPGNVSSVMEYEVAKQSIIEGKEVKVSKTQNKNAPFNAFVTNQGTTEIQSATKDSDLDPIGDTILADIQKEEAA